MEKGDRGANPRPAPQNDIWKYQIKWNHFHHMGPEYFFLTIFEAILFLVPLLSHFIYLFFSCISRTKIIFSIKTQPPSPPPHPVTKWSVPYAICDQQRRRSACASAKSDQHLCCSLPRQYDISSIYIGNFMILHVDSFFR